jgi:hypothetical protein
MQSRRGSDYRISASAVEETDCTVEQAFRKGLSIAPHSILMLTRR